MTTAGFASSGCDVRCPRAPRRTTKATARCWPRSRNPTLRVPRPRPLSARRRIPLVPQWLRARADRGPRHGRVGDPAALSVRRARSASHSLRRPWIAYERRSATEARLLARSTLDGPRHLVTSSKSSASWWVAAASLSPTSTLRLKQRGGQDDYQFRHEFWHCRPLTERYVHLFAGPRRCGWNTTSAQHVGEPTPRPPFQADPAHGSRCSTLSALGGMRSAPRATR